MQLYLNYAKEHWMHDGENPPVGVISVRANGEAVAHYALEGLANKVLAREYMTVFAVRKTTSPGNREGQERAEGARRPVETLTSLAMCGRYRRTTREEELCRIYNIPIPPQRDLPISYNIAPSQGRLGDPVQSGH